MKRYNLLFLLLLFVFEMLSSQSGQYAFRFLEFPSSAYAASLGGSNAALYKDGINGALSNPSLLSDDTDNQMALNFSNYLSDVSVGSFAYGKNIKKNLLGVGIQYVNYGDFVGRDEYNKSTGNFTAKDFAISFMYAKIIEDKWNVGVALKPIFSAYESYSSFGLAADLGASYVDIEKGMCFGLAFTNIGQQLTAYYDEIQTLPFNSVMSFTKKFSHAPFRITVSAHHLHVWDLNYTNTLTTQTLSGDEEIKEISWADMLFRHAIFGIDFEPTKNFYANASYNHRRARELALDGLKSISGMSFGGGLKLSKFNVGFAWSLYQKGISTLQFTVRTDLNRFKL